MTLEKIIRTSLYLVAPLNVLAAALFINPESALAELLQLPTDSHPFYTILSAGMVALFGVAYFWLAVQPAIVRPVLFIGASGKLLAATTAIYLVIIGELSAITGAVISGDLLFAILWFYYLFSEARE